MFNLYRDVKIVPYHNTYMGEKFRNYLNTELIKHMIKNRDLKGERRMKNCKEQVDRFIRCNNKNSTLIQVRNKYEGEVIKKYIEEEYSKKINICASIVQSETMTENYVKNMTIVLPDFDSECSRTECSCKRHKFYVENEKKHIKYVSVMKL